MAGFYAYVDPDPKLIEVYRELQRTAVNHERQGRLATALRVRQILEALKAAYRDHAAAGALVADGYIREALEASRVGRPDTAGNLSRAIRSRPLPTTLPGGAIGIASIDELNSGAVNPRSGGIYWLAQEYGLPATPKYLPKTKRHVIPGYFMPGMSTPSQDEFRNHEYFQQFSYEKGAGQTPPGMLRKRDLAARLFLAKGTARFLVWDREQRAAMDNAGIAALFAVPRGRL